jgi:hypothetical protein
MNKRRTGFTDAPINKSEEDMFGVSQYVKGLSNFIRECDTPMTIAIQGDWGSGKTSIMNMVKTELNDDVISVWFNTWKFSQFHMEDDLAITFMTYLSKEIEAYLEEGSSLKLKTQINQLCKNTVKALGIASEMKYGTGALKDAINECLQKDSVEIVDKLKKTFQDTINEISTQNNGKRVVLFIDDLDRLQPLRAVELLEVIKLFLDCENCVYVMAIDYEVVLQGINEKYHNTLDERKSRKFFEKIIQVPFKMPVAHYDISKYIKNAMKSLGIDNYMYEQDYVNLIRTSISCNPRAMKHTFNAYLLLSKVHDGDSELNTAFGKMLLFACLCLQLTYEEVYNYIVEHLATDEMDENVFVADADFFQNVYDNGIEVETCGEELYNIIKSDADYDEQLAAFLKAFCDALKQKDEKISEQTVEKLRDILQMTSITATGNIVNGNNVKGKGARHGKKYDNEFKVHSFDASQKKEIQTFNGCLAEWYSIAEKRYDGKNGSVKFSDLLQHAMEYACAQNSNGFANLRERAMNNEKDSLHKLFVPEDTKNPAAYRCITDEGYKISTYSSNDAKMVQICKIYSELGLDVTQLLISMKEAHNL